MTVEEKIVWERTKICPDIFYLPKCYGFNFQISRKIGENMVALFQTLRNSRLSQAK